MKLVIFDCDGTLIDSQHAIVAAMDYAFGSLRLTAPPRAAVLDVVGLSLPEAFRVLASEHGPSVQAELATLYKGDFPRARQAVTLAEPLYPGIREAIHALAARTDLVLGTATGKSRRGVGRLLDREGWRPHFFTVQTADDHPSKPHPSMILKAMADAGASKEETVMVGDTSFDMEMACNAGVMALAVAWGYHAADRLTAAGARAVVKRGADLVPALNALLPPVPVHA